MSTIPIEYVFSDGIECKICNINNFEQKLLMLIVDVVSCESLSNPCEIKNDITWTLNSLSIRLS